VADVWREVAAITPGPWVHVGGDEAVDVGAFVGASPGGTLMATIQKPAFARAPDFDMAAYLAQAMELAEMAEDWAKDAVKIARFSNYDSLIVIYVFIILGEKFDYLEIFGF
jgi:hypothetical protein